MRNIIAMDLPNRRSALVTGVSRQAGIGAAIARALARDGANVFISYYRPYDRTAGLSADPDEPQQILDDLRRLKHKGRRSRT